MNVEIFASKELTQNINTIKKATVGVYLITYACLLDKMHVACKKNVKCVTIATNIQYAFKTGKLLLFA